MSIENILKPNNLRLYINTESINPGTNNTFLHTNDLGVVGWTPFTADKITGGNNYDILTKDPVLGWQATQQLQNQNLPDPLIVNEIDPGNIRDDANSVGTDGQVLQKIAGDLRWGNLNLPLGDINNFTNFATDNVSAPTSVVAGGAAQQVLFNTFFDTSGNSLFSWDIANMRSGFNMLGVYDVVLELNMIYPTASSGSYVVSLVSNVTNLNGRTFNKTFNAPVLGGNPSNESVQIGFIIDQRTAPNAWIQVFVTNDANSSANIQFSNADADAGRCYFTAILLRTP